MIPTDSNPSCDRPETSAQSANGDYSELYQEVSLAPNFEAFDAILTRNDNLLTPSLLQLHRSFVKPTLFAPCFLKFADLIEMARDDRQGAWAQLLSSREELQTVKQELLGEISLVQRLKAMGGYASVISISEKAIEKARQFPLFLEVRFFQDILATSLFLLRDGNHADNVERAISVIQEALKPSMFARDSGLLTRLGTFYSERTYGDWNTNALKSIETLRNALEAHGPLDPTQPPSVNDKKAMIHTNLAVALLRYFASEHKGYEEQLQGLQEALSHCEEALRIRSPDNSLIDWVYSQLNLAQVLAGLVSLGQKTVREVESACQPVIDRQASFDTPANAHFVAMAHDVRGSALKQSAQRMVDASRASDPSPFPNLERASTPAEQLLLAQACKELTYACTWATKGQNDPLKARTSASLFHTLIEVGIKEKAMQFGDISMPVIQLHGLPLVRFEFGQKLGRMHAERKEWDLSVAAYRDAVAAANLLYHTDVGSAGQRQRSESSKYLYRSAAYALAASGDLEGAMIALEDGRAKELRQRFATTSVDEETMKDVPESLREAYYSAAEALARSPLLASDADAPAARTLNTVVDAIRSIPGHRGFATGARASELTGAVEDGWPLIYVNPTVFGTLLLLVRRAEGEVEEGLEDLRYSCRFIEGLPNGQITKTLLIGQKKKNHKSDFYLSIFNDRNDATFPETLGNALDWAGNRLAKNIHDFVMGYYDEVDRERSPVRITLVPCGHISLIPLDAASWIDSRTRERRCLADDFVVRYAPSGIIAAASIRKVEAFDNSLSSRVPHLLAIGDPLQDLSSARFEIEGISHHFPADSRHIAYGDAATLPFLTAHAPQATHIHLAIHAASHIVLTLSASQASIYLAEGPLLATQIPATLSLGQTRLTVISACESAVRGLEGVDEAFSIGTVMLAAGSACAIGSLWRVDDVATSLLMVRMYEEMMGRGKRPPEALAEAKRWLRELDLDADGGEMAEDKAEDVFWGRYRGMKSEAEESGFVGRAFEHPFYWAGFVALGA